MAPLLSPCHFVMHYVRQNGGIQMQAIQTQALQLASFSQLSDPNNVVRAAWPVYRDTGAAGRAVVYFELDRGMELPSHTDSAEEVLVVLEGEVEATVGGESRRLGAGGIAVVPAMAPPALPACSPATPSSPSSTTSSRGSAHEWWARRRPPPSGSRRPPGDRHEPSGWRVGTLSAGPPSDSGPSSLELDDELGHGSTTA